MGAKIAISGKGGVGKSTVCAVLGQLFAKDGLEVLLIDADPTVSLASALGIPLAQSPEPLINMKELIHERTSTKADAVGAYFRLNPKVSDLPAKFSRDVNNLKLFVLGGISRAGSGCACPEGAFLKAMLTHLILHREEVVLVDLAAGVEFLGRASIEGIDALLIVVEPGGRSIEAAVNIARMGAELGIKYIAAIANKLTDPQQLAAIQSQMPAIPILAAIEYSAAIQQADLQRKDVFATCPTLADPLGRVKAALKAVVASGGEGK
ncbi:MAG: AAA family ATPase [Sedimentisphaerales bacterium]|nr:AAA family ATPase [Sedimentisphaerales bacterium]